MRINLKVPFAEKDAVKALGARWDTTKKVWYIVDVKDLTPFKRWIPSLASLAELPDAGPEQLAKPPAKAPATTAKGHVTKLAVEVPHCGCKVLPWEDCDHSLVQRVK